MIPDHLLVYGILACSLVLFAWGRFRYDFVAILALVAGVFLGVVPAANAFSGFSHPAVITVAAVLIISKALQNSGVVTWLASFLAPTRTTNFRQVAASSGLVAMLSCVMNNVGALALMLPVTLQNAKKARRSASLVLMPLSFASLLGGLVTLIGTPTNIVIAAYRKEFTGDAFQMFDFTPVGATVAFFGLLYIWFIGWRLLPNRISAQPAEGIFHVEDYVSEVLIPEGSPIAGQRVRHLERECEGEISVMTIIRQGRKRRAPSGIEKFREGDILTLEGDPSLFEPLIAAKKLKLIEAVPETKHEHSSDDVRVVEAVVLPNSPIEGQSMRGIQMHDRYGINLLAISRQGETPKTRLANTRFRIGDVLLIQGEASTLEQGCSHLNLLELAERGLRKKQQRGIFLPIVIFATAIIAAALGVLPVTIAFVSAVIALIAFKVINAREVYTSIEWPIIILLGALIPLGEALQSSGGTAIIANGLTAAFKDMPVWMIIGSLLVVSMWLSDIIPNTPVAVLMAPISATTAGNLGLSLDPFLMAVAIGCATPFLTPIGHQSNTLVMGPGGYRFTDYARMGFGLELLIVIVAVPAILWIWPV